MHHALRNIFRHTNHIQATHAGGQEHYCQHPVLRFTHRFCQGVVLFSYTVCGFHFLQWRIFHQHGTQQNHHHRQTTPNHEGTFQADGCQQMAVDIFEAQAAETVRTNGKCRNQTFTLREPFHAVGKGQQITRAIGQADQHTRAEPQHQQVIGVSGKEETDTQQHTRRHCDFAYTKAFLQFARNRGGNRQTQA
ncbi:hypothetical protein D3C75_701800 [compost metagenome]